MPIVLFDIPEQALSRGIKAGRGRSFEQDLAGRGSDDKGVGYEGGQINYWPMHCNLQTIKGRKFKACLLDERKGFCL